MDKNIPSHLEETMEKLTSLADPEQLKELLEEHKETLINAYKEGKDTITKVVEENPFSAVLVAGGIGILAGLILRMNQKYRK